VSINKIRQTYLHTESAHSGSQTLSPKFRIALTYQTFRLFSQTSSELDEHEEPAKRSAD